MKRVLKVFLVVVLFLVGIKGIKADVVTLYRENIDNLYGFHYRYGGVLWTYGRIPFRYMNGRLAYCVQPDTAINTNTYYTFDDFSVLGYSDEIKKEMELISYYGYQYPGHDSLNYYLATQELIWLYSDDERITWNYDGEEYGEKRDVSYEKSEIIRLINNHNKKPSFYDKVNETNTNELVLIDDNNVLDNYDINSSLDIIKDGNKLIIKSDNIGEYEISFNKRRSISESTVAYNNNDIWTQKMASFGEPYIEEFSIKVRFNNSNIIVNKKDNETNELIIDKGNIIKINNVETNETIFNSLEFIDGKTNISLPIGKYKIEEISASSNYVLNKEGLTFEIKYSDPVNKEIDFYNKKAKGQIEILKKDEEGNLLKGVEFEIYDINDNIVDKVVTDEVTVSKILPLGGYKIKESKELYGYEKNNDIYEINLDYDNQNTPLINKSIEVINKKILCEITLITTSSEEVLNTSFNIYDKEYNLIYNGKTVDGKASISLPYGDYILKEIEVPNGYKLNEEEISFSVNDLVCQSSFKINNEKVIMPVTSSSGNIFYIILFTINIIDYAIYKKIK